MFNEISTDFHVKSFAGQVIAIDVFCSLNKAAILGAEQLNLVIKTSRYVN